MVGRDRRSKKRAGTDGSGHSRRIEALALLGAVTVVASGCVATHPDASTQTASPTSELQAGERPCGIATNDGRAWLRFVNIRVIESTVPEVGCDEALTVATEYLNQPRNTHLALIDSWSCRGVSTPGTANVCTRDGVDIVMHAVRR